MNNKRTSKVKNTLLAIILLTFLIAIIGGTYARYASSGNANANAQIAKWNIKLQNEDITYTDTTVDVLATTVDNVSNSNVSRDKIAPGQTLGAKVQVNPEGSEVAIDYLVDFGNIQTTNFNNDSEIKISKVVATLNGTTYDMAVSNGKYIFFESLEDVLAGKVVEICAYVTWTDGDVTADTYNGVNSEEIIVPINILARQHLESDGFVSNVSTAGNIASAIANLNEGDTLVLSDNIDLREEYGETQGTIVRLANDSTLDLNDKTITSYNKNLVYQGNNIVIENGKFETDGSYALFLGGSDVLMDENDQTYGYTLNNLTLRGGLNTDHVWDVELNNVNITGNNYHAVWGNSQTNITINSGTYNIGTAGHLFGMYKVKVENDAAAGNENGTFVVNGGTFITGNSSSKLYHKDSKGTFVVPTIYGGTFDCVVPSECIPEGYECVEQGEGWYVVQAIVNP